SGEWPAALELVFQHVTPAARPARVHNALQLIRSDQLDPAGVWVVRGNGQLLGAMVCVNVPGASALVWPPQARKESGRREIEDVLLQAALPWLRRRGAKLAQTLLALHETGLSPALERNGFQHITRLWYMRHDLGLPERRMSEMLTLDY